MIEYVQIAWAKEKNHGQHGFGEVSNWNRDMEWKAEAKLFVYLILFSPHQDLDAFWTSIL